MGLEIERRFIVKGDEWKTSIQTIQEFEQGYLVTNDDGWTVRVRIIDKKESWLTIKYPKEKFTRYEFEYKIPLSDGEELFKISNYKLSKTRYGLNLNNQYWVVDCFKEKNFPLVLAEIEMNSAEEKIQKPKWCSFEVSNLKEWSNAELAKSPIAVRTIEKKPTFL